MTTTTKAAHTPGPWHTGTGSRPSDTKDLAIVGEGLIIARAEHNISDLDRARANSRLIAAAPEMLEALEALLDISDFATNSRTGEIHLHAMAAIQKARGGQ